MKSNYLVLLKTKMESVYALIIDAQSFSDAEKKALNVPGIEHIIQITLYN